MRTLFTSVFMLALLINLSASDSIMYNGQPLFLNGANLAWINFARDIGPDANNWDQYGKVFRETHDYGANCIRLWLHTNGASTPEFVGDSVVGPGTDAIADLKQILDSAYKYDVGLILCLWSHDMLRLDIGETYLTRNRALLEDTVMLESYIQNALIPMVDSTKDHPGIIAWEVFNEPEGMIAGVPDGGWSSHGHVTREQIQFAVNRIAGAIHRVEPTLLVTNGTHTLSSNSDRGLGNFYSDDALFSVGGDPDGYLDFYQVHYYDFDLNPFAQPYSYWNLDKPLIIGEFHPDCNQCGDFSNYENLINNGYAGALGWMWLDEYGDLIREEVQYTFLNHTAEVDIDNMLGDTPYLSFSGPEYGQVFEPGSNIDFITQAYDTDGTIAKVEYFLVNETADDSVLTTITELPYNYTWVSPEEGFYKVYVSVTDNDGYFKVSKPLAFTVGDPPLYRYEAEEAELSAATVVNDATASGGKYVNFTQDCSILWNVLACPADGIYEMIIGFGVPYGEKNNYITINGDTESTLDVHFAGAASGWLRDTIQVNLLEGANTVEINDFWGWMTFDFIEFPFPRPPFVSEIILSTSTGNFYIDEPGGTLQMIATVMPEDAGIKEVRWTLNNPTIASIDENGLLTAMKDGVVRVFAWSLDGTGIVVNVDVTLSNQITALDQESLAQVRIYPNPASTELFIDSNEKVRFVSLHNIQGQLIRYYPMTAGHMSIDISDIEKGMYYLSIGRIDGTTEIQRFIKQ